MPAARSYLVPPHLAGRTLAQIVREQCEGISWNKARELCQNGKVTRNGVLARDAALRLQAGDAIEITPHAPRVRDDVLPERALLYFDAQLAVVDKPAGLLSVPFDAADKDTLIDRTTFLLRRKSGERDAELGAVQRLDKDTSGVMLFTRTLAAKRHMQELFRRHDIERRYVALAHGVVKEASYETELLRDRGDGLRGSYGHFRRPRGPVPEAAQRAITHVRPLEVLRGATLVECRIETGRQHQIRIHLSEAGHPVVGEPVYIRDFTGPKLQAKRPMLHARVLGFSHPRDGKPMHFEAEPPEDFTQLLSKLRAR